MKKWNFPEYINEAIEFHHSPLNSDARYRDVVFATYLANAMCLLEERKFDFLYMEDEVLKFFSISSEEIFNNLHSKLKSLYDNQPVT